MQKGYLKNTITYTSIVLPCKIFKQIKKNFMAPFFYGWGSTASRLQPL